MAGYVVVFFDDQFNIKKAHKTDSYPTVKNIVYYLKLLEKSELKDIEDLRMDILTEEDFNSIE